MVSTQAYERIYTEAVEDIVAWLDGSPIRLLSPQGRTHTSSEDKDLDGRAQPDFLKDI